VRASAQPLGVGNETMSWLSSSQLAFGAGSGGSRPQLQRDDPICRISFQFTEEAYYAFNLALDARRANSHHNSNRAFRPLSFWMESAQHWKAAGRRSFYGARKQRKVAKASRWKERNDDNKH
jgi:hypothetical protein